MNPLTLVKRIQNINSKEASLGISDEASWHAKYKDSAYVFVGGIPYDLTEGDLLTVFAQYGEIVDVNLVRDKGTGKSKGFAFIAYEDQRSTNLAVDNLNGATVAGRIIRVDHVTNYKKKEEEDEEAERKKREERGVCRAFQRGECTRGAGCKFSHDEQRAANTGWGADDQKGRWGHDKFDGPPRSERRPDNRAQTRLPESSVHNWRSHDTDVGHASKSKDMRSGERDEYRSRRHVDEELETRDDQRQHKRSRRSDGGDHSRSASKDYGRRYVDEHSKGSSRENDDRREEKRSRRGNDDLEPRDKREEKQSRRHESESYPRKDEDRRGESRSTRGRDLSSTRHRGRDDRHRESDR
ncbi:zinc finger CCCH domain-containing protein 25 [Punica granatum]|uniref:Zinc finger CCCH domain-containing protein 25 n=1 Tax=Punica granatum TaxID=22663 RepID=A0A218W2L6_PUNGR|nr:zinc finger CCCH domain-containing protein 25 [Punica granatum]OWM66708.1 hypothetical protein CDL15_Pgr010359 [Punica granatum]